MSSSKPTREDILKRNNKSFTQGDLVWFEILEGDLQPGTILGVNGNTYSVSVGGRTQATDMSRGSPLLYARLDTDDTADIYNPNRPHRY